MIVCHRRTFDARCRQRGYTLEQAMPCVVSQDGERWTVDETHPSYPRARPGLGDMVAGVLSAVGVTEERVAAVLGRPCGCHARRQALNRLGRRLGIG